MSKTSERLKAFVTVHLLLMQNNRILLLRRFQTGYEDGNYSVIAGHVDGNEEIKAAMIREAREEASIIILPEDLDVIGVMHRKNEDERIDFFLSARKWEGQILNAEPHKCDEVDWYDLDAIPNNTISYIRQAIENAKKSQCMWFESFGWN